MTESDSENDEEVEKLGDGQDVKDVAAQIKEEDEDQGQQEEKEADDTDQVVEFVGGRLKRENDSIGATPARVKIEVFTTEEIQFPGHDSHKRSPKSEEDDALRKRR